mmetsp:Transcript_48166/g.134112  ORF Transcript_48166/g.134112 Transcript_48166/m.134112 type:complete len:91 (+) Transcript_48166:197-469(+)
MGRRSWDFSARVLMIKTPPMISHTEAQYKTYRHQPASLISAITMSPDKHAVVMWAPSKIVIMKTPLYRPKPLFMKTWPPNEVAAAALINK